MIWCKRKYCQDAIIDKLTEKNWFFGNMSLDERAAKLHENIKTSVDSLIIKKEIKIRRNGHNNWYTEELKDLKNQRDKLYEKTMLTRDRSHWEEYKKIRKSYLEKLRIRR
jgi:hypothetical protein